MLRWLCYLPLNLLMGLVVIHLAPIATVKTNPFHLNPF